MYGRGFLCDGEAFVDDAAAAWTWDADGCVGSSGAGGGPRGVRMHM